MSVSTVAMQWWWMPYATLMYVWCNHDPLEGVLVNTRTDRVRKIVMESGPGNLHRWLEYERDIRADFFKAFGEPPGALVAIGIMTDTDTDTDTDNTGSTARAWYGPIELLQPAEKKKRPRWQSPGKPCARAPTAAATDRVLHSSLSHLTRCLFSSFAA